MLSSTSIIAPGVPMVRRYESEGKRRSIGVSTFRKLALTLAERCMDKTNHNQKTARSRETYTYHTSMLHCEDY